MQSINFILSLSTAILFVICKLLKVEIDIVDNIAVNDYKFQASSLLANE